MYRGNTRDKKDGSEVQEKKHKGRASNTMMEATLSNVDSFTVFRHMLNKLSENFALRLSQR